MAEPPNDLTPADPAQPPEAAKPAAGAGGVPIGAIKLPPPTGRALAPASADAADPVAPILLEFESPTAALLARPVPLRSRFAVWVILAMVATAITIAATMPIDRVVTTNGKVVATNNNVVVQPLDTSIVRSIDVQEGQIVKKGDLLARLDPTFASADAGSLEAQVSSLSAEVARLHAELDGKPYLSDGTPSGQLQASIFAQRHAERSFKMENYAQKIDALKAKLSQAASDVAAYTDRLAVAKTMEEKRRELERLQVGSQINTLAAIDARVESERFLAGAKATVLSTTRDLDAMIAERDGFDQQWKAETSQQLTDQDRKLSDATESLRKAKLRRELVELRADRDAIVLSIAPISVGSVMASGDQFITMVPVDSPLEIETVLDGRDAGFVAVGDPVTIKFETFPYFTYGTAEGVVRLISPDSFHNPTQDREQVSKPRTEQAAGVLFYRVRATIDRMKLHDLPAGFRLTPGMPVIGDVKIGKRTFFQYIMSRVIPVAKEGMREP